MALTLKHAFQSAKTDGADSTLVQPSNWNANHTLTGSNNILFGTNGSGAGGEITVSTGLSLSASTITVAIGTSVQAWDGDLDAIAALAGSSGYLKKTGANTWTLDTSTFQPQIATTGILKGSGSGVLATATAGTDYLAPPSGTSLLKANSGGALANATAGTDYLAPPSGTAILKANSGGALANAAAGTDYVAPGGAAGAITATGLKETKTAPSISSGTLTLDCSAGNVFAVSLNANITTLSFSNVPASGTAYGMTLQLIADGTARAVTWGSAVKWPGGTAPTLTSTNTKKDTFVLTTWDGGTTWDAFIGGQNS